MKIFLNISLIILLVFSTLSGKSQNPADTSKKDNYTPYELLSTYYDEDFRPFRKGNIYVGLDFSLEDKKLINADYLVQKVLDGDKFDYNIQIKGGYYTGNYAMVGLNFKYFQQKFDGTIFKDPDTLFSNSITRGFSITPNFRSSVPLTKNERLSFFTEIGLTFGTSNTLSNNTKNVDVIDRMYTTNYNLRVGLSPGITFFAMENFAFELQLNLLGYEMETTKKRANGVDGSTIVRQNIDFNINILSINLGLAYYLGARQIKIKHKK